MTNCITVGTTTSGKSTAKARDLFQAIDHEEFALVVCDPHRNSLAWWLFIQFVAMGLKRRTIFDRFSDLGRVIGYKFLQPSDAEDELERRAENDERIQAFTDVLCRRRGLSGLERNPLTEEWVQAALHLYVEHDKDAPLSVLPYAFEPGHSTFQRLVDGCLDPDIADKFRTLGNGNSRRGHIAPAHRLISGVCRSTAFQARCGSSFNLDSFLDDCGILLVEGGSVGNVSYDAMRTMMGAIILKVIHYVRNRRRPIPRVRMVIDEATNADLIGHYECRALAETQKMGLDVDIMVQNLNFGSSFVQENVLQNCMRHEWFYCGNAAVAQLGAADLGDSKYKEELMALARGVRYVKEHRDIYREYVKPLEDPWCFPGLAQKKAQKALWQIQKRPEYQSGKSAIVPLSNGSESTRAPSDSSTISSPAERLRTAG